MKTLDDIRIKFESPMWAMSPEFAVIDTILEERPDLIELVKLDVLKGVKNNKMGRKDGPSVEQIVRAGIYKEIRRLTYSELEFHQYDSSICRTFLHLDKCFSSSVLQGYISKINSASLKSIMVEINMIACGLGYEDFKDIRTDSTAVEADVQRPTNNSLVYDCIKTTAIFFEKIKEKYADKYNVVEAKRVEAKKINFGLNNVTGAKNDTQSAKEVKAEKMKELFTEYLKIHQEIHQQVKALIASGMDDFKENQQKRIIKLEGNMSIVYNNAYKFQIEGKQVETSEKIFSIYEDHTDIIVKGLRDIIFGHKVNLSTGRSNLILYCNIEEGNPSDTSLFQEPIDTIKEDYGVKKFRGIATDGGFASLKNLLSAAKDFTNVVFTKVVGSLQNIVENVEIETEMKKWRAGIEGNISNLKRGFKLTRVTWKGKEMFDAKIFWSVIGYNIRVLTSHILTTLQAGQ